MGERKRRLAARSETLPGAERTWAAATDAFLRHSAIERGLAPKTIEAYGADLVRFSEYLARERVAALRELARPHLTGFLGSLEAQGLGPRSRARMLVSTRRFVQYLATTGRIALDPSEGVAAPRLPRVLPRTLRPDETAALIEAAAPDGALGLRDRAMLELLYGSGLRVTELVGLPLSDIDRRAGLVRVVGKGRKERVVPVSEPALDALEAYLVGGRAALLARTKRRSDAAFVTARGSAMTRQNFFARLRTLAVGGGGGRKRCRRTYCATPSRPICWRAARICERCRRCLVTRISRRRRFTPT